MTQIPARLLRAYRHTTYRIYVENRHFDLAIGRRSFRLDGLLDGKDPSSAALLTAWNPYSRGTPAPRNAAAQRELAAELRRRKLVALRARGFGKDPRWPPEESLLVLGIAYRDAFELGRAFQQNAILFARAGRPVALVRLR